MHDLILKAQYSGDIEMAARYFEQALARDPSAARAHAGMAGVWLSRQQLYGAPVGDAGPRAKAAALKAVELDDTSAPAHAALGSVHLLVDFDLPGAEREFRRAIELNPYEADLPNYAQVLIILGRPDEAIQQAERAVAIEPLDTYPRSFYALALLFARRYDEALAQADQVLRAQPGNAVALGAVLSSQHMKQRYADVITAQATYYVEVGRPELADAIKKGYAESGYAEAWRQANAVELAKYGDKPGTAYDVGVNYAMAGDRARALDWLEKACAERDPNVMYLGINPVLDSLRAEPRFQALLRKMNLPQ